MQCERQRCRACVRAAGAVCQSVADRPRMMLHGTGWAHVPINAARQAAATTTTTPHDERSWVKTHAGRQAHVAEVF